MDAKTVASVILKRAEVERLHRGLDTSQRMPFYGRSSVPLSLEAEPSYGGSFRRATEL
jgi:hypothetical protein